VQRFVPGSLAASVLVFQLCLAVWAAAVWSFLC